MGLRIMNYRANTIGAALDIEPHPKSGTTVTCALPFQNGPKISRRPTPTHEESVDSAALKAEAPLHS
jgi:hypothetical protein